MKWFFGASVLLQVCCSSVNAVQIPSDSKVHVLIYETERNNNRDDVTATTPAERLVDQVMFNGQRPIAGISASLFGQDVAFEGYGSKFAAVLPILQSIQVEQHKYKMENYFHYDPLIVLSDSRDVLLNNPYGDAMYGSSLADEFVFAFDELTAQYQRKDRGAIVISAEAQCCVSALTHVPVGGYFNADGTRKQFACYSGADDCLWAGDEHAEPWEKFMHDLMVQRTVQSNDHSVPDDTFLNAGLIVGRVSDLIAVITSAQIQNSEDDQAVLTDYMYHNPESIVLDYHQKLFGNNRNGVINLEDGTDPTGGSVNGCVFERQNDSKRLVHTQTSTYPLFLHSPGGFYQCYDYMSEQLNIPAISSTIRRQLLRQSKSNRKLQCNYGRTGLGSILGQGQGCSDKDNGNNGNQFGELLNNRTEATTITNPLLPASNSTVVAPSFSSILGDRADSSSKTTTTNPLISTSTSTTTSSNPLITSNPLLSSTPESSSSSSSSLDGFLGARVSSNATFMAPPALGANSTAPLSLSSFFGSPPTSSLPPVNTTVSTNPLVTTASSVAPTNSLASFFGSTPSTASANVTTTNVTSSTNPIVAKKTSSSVAPTKTSSSGGGFGDIMSFFKRDKKSDSTVVDFGSISNGGL